MIYLLNSLTVIVGLPLLAASFLLIALFHPASARDFPWPSHIHIILFWLFAFVLFSFVYAKRARWIKNRGIFYSWSILRGYLSEAHSLLEVSENEYNDFLRWSELPETPKGIRDEKIAKEIYIKIKSLFKSEQITQDKFESYIKCLAQYVSRWPLHDEEF